MSEALNECHMSKSIKTMERVIPQNSFDDSAFRSSERTAPLELECFGGKGSMSKRPNYVGRWNGLQDHLELSTVCNCSDT